MILLVLPWAANLEVRNVSLVVVDDDRSVISSRLIHKIEASDYFHLLGQSSTYEDALERLEKGEVDALIKIPSYFEKMWITSDHSSILIAVNAVNGSKGGVALSYLQQMITDYARELNLESTNVGIELAKIKVSDYYLFNKYLDYKVFMLPALMVSLLTMFCGFLPALNVVREKEIGTIEQINVTPVGKWTFVLAKMIPYWIVGFVILTIAIFLIWLIYDLFPTGSVITLYLLVVIFVLAIAGLGLVISNYSVTMQQAMFVIWFCLLVFILMSGMFTPIESMPQWAQIITYLNPLRYLVQVMRAIYLKGASMTDLYAQCSALIGFAILFDTWAVWSYRKKN